MVLAIPVTMLQSLSTEMIWTHVLDTLTKRVGNIIIRIQLLVSRGRQTVRSLGGMEMDFLYTVNAQLTGLS